MEYHELGTSGIKASEIVLGTWSMGCWPDTDEEQAIETIHTALDNGINFIDTAHGYRAAEGILGKALKGRRSDAVVCTKIAIIEGGADYSNERFGYDFVMRGVERALERLGTDYIDVYLSHFYNPEVSIKETMHVFSDLRDQKVIRAFGVSGYEIGQLEEAAQYAKIDVGQYPLSIFTRRFNESSNPAHPPSAPMDPLLEYALENNIAMMCYGAMAHGLLSGRFTGDETFHKDDVRCKRDKRYQGEAFKQHVAAAEKMRPIAEKHGKTLAQLAINWVLQQPGATTALIGVRTPEQVLDNAGGSGWYLDAEDLQEIENIVSELQ